MNASTVCDSDFTNVTGVEPRDECDNAGTFTLGAAAAAAGVVTVFTDDNTADTPTLGAGFTNNVSVTLADDVAANTLMRPPTLRCLPSTPAARTSTATRAR